MSIDIEDIANNAVEESLKEFRGRLDFPGHDQISMEDKNVIQKYICGDKLG